MDPSVLMVWYHFQKGYNKHLNSSHLGENERKDAKKSFRDFAAGCEKVIQIFPSFSKTKQDKTKRNKINNHLGILQHIGIKACTISTHMIGVEADHQIPKTGPIKESMSSWIERKNQKAVEETMRR